MAWTRQAPKDNGYYWTYGCRRRWVLFGEGEVDWILDIAHVPGNDDGSRRYVYFAGDDRSYDIEDIIWWGDACPPPLDFPRQTEPGHVSPLKRTE